MTGPDYPRGPLPGSNAIGSFVIGVSPVGDIPDFDVWDTIISQYANAPVLTTLLTNMFAYLDQTKNFDDFFDLVWNVDTAQGWGLDVWGRIVGVTRVLPILTTDQFLGFEEQSGAGIDPFNQAPFYSGSSLTSNFALSDTAFRRLILAKALANITDGSIPSINQLLLNLFPSRGNCYVTDGENMTMTYTFEFALTPVEYTIVARSGVLPKSVGVSATVVTP